MDRKLFLSYIQNMQRNNQDMIGFQNSITKNSWQNPKSLYEVADPDSFLSELEKKFHKHVMTAVHGTENDIGYYAATVQGLPQGIEDIHIKGFSDDPTSAHEGPGHSKTMDGVNVAIDAHDALTTYGIPEDSRLYSRLSPDDQQVVRRLFVKEMGNRHQAEMADREDEGRLSAADAAMKRNRPVE